MELTVKLDHTADIPFLKQLLSQLSGIKSVEFSDGDKTYSWDEIEGHELFKKVLEQSEDDYKNGRYREMTDEMFDEIFRS
ncbi:hypothetical protein CO230_09025 [Chryseobacterium sp. 6424]|uniref:hypothetical protein n=1 Tax=Chryseobacterium sp. 6424 TaxID=2039166 RepID=UPI000EFCE35A|nr:hypothetical protein [Chryseobacterium sp. 6424]AYO58254.1 hypothetical protein CO230_09025 [Chryseobacterium sp. 6424]